MKPSKRGGTGMHPFALQRSGAYHTVYGYSDVMMHAQSHEQLRQGWLIGDWAMLADSLLMNCSTSWTYESIDILAGQQVKLLAFHPLHYNTRAKVCYTKHTIQNSQ